MAKQREKAPEKTVEEQAREFFDREKAAYEKRTGQKVKFVPPVSLTQTPVKEENNEGEQGGNEDENASITGDNNDAQDKAE